jgi:hypothetical protein
LPELPTIPVLPKSEVLTPLQYNKALTEIEDYLDVLWLQGTDHLEELGAATERWSQSESRAGQLQAIGEVIESANQLMVRQVHFMKATVSLIQLVKGRP